jgi:hypothetical protein
MKPLAAASPRLFDRSSPTSGPVAYLAAPNPAPRPPKMMTPTAIRPAESWVTVPQPVVHEVSWPDPL